MARAASARRYAQAVFQIALERDELDAWRDDLSVLAQAVENKEFAEFLDAPQVPTAKKVSVAKEALGDTVGPLALNLVSLLASRNAAHTMPGVVEQYQLLLDDHRGVERAEVVSAVSLDDQQERSIVALLEKIVGKDVQLVSRIEPWTLGGFVAKAGDRVIDGSTRTKLDRMRREFGERVS
jgi:F-type H+-transporting ATPase subunit delta